MRRKSRGGRDCENPKERPETKTAGEDPVGLREFGKKLLQKELIAARPVSVYSCCCWFCSALTPLQVVGECPAVPFSPKRGRSSVRKPFFLCALLSTPVSSSLFSLVHSWAEEIPPLSHSVSQLSALTTVWSDQTWRILLIRYKPFCPILPLLSAPISASHTHTSLLALVNIFSDLAKFSHISLMFCTLPYTSFTRPPSGQHDFYRWNCCM